MTKPRWLALGIGLAGALCALVAGRSAGLASVLWAWTAAACALVALAYLRNRPEVFGKRRGRLAPSRVLLLLPYLLAFWLACAALRAWRRLPAWSEVAPGLYVGGRPSPDALPPDVALIVDLTSEFSAPTALRAHPGYRSLPVLDGAHPPDDDAFLAILAEAARARGGVLFHCESGVGRAPTAAALALIARGVARDGDSALELVRKGRPWSAPTGVDRRFIERIASRLEVPREA